MEELANDAAVRLESEAAGGRYSIRAVARALDILDVLGRAKGGTSLGDIAKAVGLPKSSTFRYLVTLEDRGYVMRSVGDVFWLGIGRTSMRPRDVARLSAVALGRMQELSRRYEETINLGALDGHRVVYLQVVESSKAMRFAAAMGSTDPIHSSALGKAISSVLADDEVRAILAADGMRALTDYTITSVADFLSELERVRSVGYAVDDGENEEGGRCVAVSLSFPLGAAMSLSAPAARLPRENLAAVAATLRRAADDLSQELRNAGA